jgi:hypothetical protein
VRSGVADSIEVDARRNELETVLRSSLFARAPSLANLLSYLGEKALAGDTADIKEYTLAVEVFGRKPDFDQDADSIVRVEANRLRKRLERYYLSEGSEHALRIRIPVGQYVPVFETHAAEAQVAAKKWRQTITGRVALVIAICAAVVALVGAFMFVLRRSTRRAVIAEHAATTEPILPVGLPAGEKIRIACGSDRAYVDRAGDTWSADQFFTGGTAVHGAAVSIARTQDAALYRRSRQGDFRYDIPLKPGVYEVRLHFAETAYGVDDSGAEGSRLMRVSANGKTLLSYFDVAADAGASRTADVKVFTDISPADDGRVHLEFSSVHGGRAMISGIEVLPGRRGQMRPVRIATRTTAYYSEDTRWWMPDTYFRGGQIAERVGEVAGAEDKELFETERWGNFSYAIPVAPGHYRVTLLFAERQFGPSNRERFSGPAELAGTGAGSRVFSVFCNGKALLRDFDIFAEARGENRAIEKRFTALEPNAQGKLVLDFIPVKNYATVTAIEVVPE